MTDAEHKAELRKVARQALDVWEGCASNPRAIARALVTAVDAACVTGSGEIAGLDGTPARVMVAHLAALMFARFDGIGGVDSRCGDTIQEVNRLREWLAA